MSNIEKQLMEKTDKELELVKELCAEYRVAALNKNKGIEQAKKVSAIIFKLVTQEQNNRNEEK